ncbi:MAG: quinone-dependent dihydroorotate dehydrogenase [Cytophagaceae bacterium]
MYKFLLKPLLFCLSPERAHHITFSILGFAFKLPFIKSIVKANYSVTSPSLEKTVFGLTFKNPVGLAAGFDKDAKHIDALEAFGFGFIEIGTLTPKGQPGNDKPRLFRIPEDEALINRMGFNNGGVYEAAERLKNRNSNIIVGGNIGKNKLTPNEEAASDYEKCFDVLYPYVDYFVANVSSPNTPGLRELQDKEPLKKLLKAIIDRNLLKDVPKPILLKIAPDLTNEQLDDIIAIATELNLSGLIATNTTIDRGNLCVEKSTLEQIGMGGLSGKPLTNRSTEVIKYLTSRTRIPVIGVGGIHSPEDAIEKLEAGAVLVQIYTGFIYEGPALVKNINKALMSS